MSLIPVKSGNIKAVGYDPKARTLTVAFHSGASHDYYDVSPENHAGMMKAHETGESVGKYFHANIRNAHKSKKLDDR